MERTMSVEEKIRRAEEIYNRRRENENRTTSTRVRVDNTKFETSKNINKRLRKMIIQIIVCMLIYLTFHYIINNDYIFSADFKNKCKEILAYDISFSEMYKNISSTITTMQEKYQETTQNSEDEEQMKKDAEDIKSKISFIKPLVGTITSAFGVRNPTVSTVSKYHTGIDIATNEGTDIISATNGTVVLASSTEAYGKHLKIQVEDVTIIYAHCLSLEVAEGDKINQGQVIAKVGSTGNSTGPHLHFEIRKENRYVDPSLILEF